MSDLPQTPAEVRARVGEIAARADALPSNWQVNRLEGVACFPCSDWDDRGDICEVGCENVPICQIDCAWGDDGDRSWHSGTSAIGHEGAEKIGVFIAASRTDIPALCALVLWQAEAIERVEALADAWDSQAARDRRYANRYNDDEALGAADQKVVSAEALRAAVRGEGGQDA